jgi:predicted ribosome quality control (RQC) complex YloA/Tae2 family protein
MPSAAGVTACALMAFAQDAAPLGDVARQTRVEKQQPSPNTPTPAPASKSSSDDTTQQSSAQPKTSHVITNDDLPEHNAAAPAPAPASPNRANPHPAVVYQIKRPAEYWRAQALQLKNSIAQVQRHLDTLNDSLHAVLTNSSDEPVWNYREKERERQITDLQAQLNDLHRRLEDTQEAARRQGYGSSVYDP